MGSKYHSTFQPSYLQRHQAAPATSTENQVSDECSVLLKERQFIAKSAHRFDSGNLNPPLMSFIDFLGVPKKIPLDSSSLASRAHSLSASVYSLTVISFKKRARCPTLCMMLQCGMMMWCVRLLMLFVCLWGNEWIGSWWSCFQLEDTSTFLTPSTVSSNTTPGSTGWNNTTKVPSSVTPPETPPPRHCSARSGNKWKTPCHEISQKRGTWLEKNHRRIPDGRLRFEGLGRAKEKEEEL